MGLVGTGGEVKSAENDPHLGSPSGSRSLMTLGKHLAHVPHTDDGTSVTVAVPTLIDSLNQ